MSPQARRRLLASLHGIERDDLAQEIAYALRAAGIMGDGHIIENAIYGALWRDA